MTWKDPILAKIRKIRDAHVEKCNDDMTAIFEDIKAFEKASGLKYDLPPKRKKLAKKTAQQPGDMVKRVRRID